MRRGELALLLGGALSLTAIACPIARPPVPPEYYDFRADLQIAVTDTALVELEGLPRMQAHLDSRLTELAAITRTDSLFSTLSTDPVLIPLAGAIATSIRILFERGDYGGDARDAFNNPDGQRLAVDAIVVGLGRAVYLLREDGLDG